MQRTAIIFVVLAVMAAYLPTTAFDFVNWDDNLHVYNNPLVLSDEVPLSDLLLTPSLGYPIPVTVLTYRAEHALFGLEPAAFHTTNLLLHLLSVVLLFLIARRLGASPLSAALAAALFGLHPVCAEPVSWISGRKDVLAVTLGLWAFWDFLRHPFDWRAPRSYVSVLLYLLACLAKPVVIALPIVMGIAVSMRRCVPFVGIGVFVFVLASSIQNGALTCPNCL